nr:hypothetical protein DM860_016599 [Ipomoea trifida]
MDLRTPPNRVRKRPLSDVYSEPPKKRISDEDGGASGGYTKQVYSEMAKRKQRQAVTEDEDTSGVQKGQTFSFRVLLPNGTTLELKIREPGNDMSVDQLVEAIRAEYCALKCRTESHRRQINWKSQNLYILDPFDRKLKGLYFRKLNPRKSYLLRLQDGSVEAERFENMWDLTPDTDLLKELPEEYSFESALADLIDNSLQAVWSNDENERRLISVKLFKNKITIFDSGPGMDGDAETSIAKWGKMGASLHRSSKGKAIGCKPPYLKPYFGMFGYGGPIASMHLGRRATVSSKTKASKKVYILHLEREDLLSCSSSEKTWRTSGGLRDPSDYEIRESPHGSFTKVEIFEPKLRCQGIKKLQGKLKDIYFPYIQCDEISETGQTTMATEFQVNETNLAEVLGGEVAITNIFSCNGPDFTLQLHFTLDSCSIQGIGHQEANARLKCVYFPVTQGKESIERIIENLKDEGYENLQNFESFSRVTVRRLGRLLPDAHWTNLAHCNPFTIALKNFGNKTPEKDVHVEIYKDGKELSFSQLEKQYHEWISKMHEKYDLEIESGDDQPTLVLGYENRKELGTSSDGQRIKILKGACAGFHRTNTFATLEFIILEGWEGDAGGDARIICRPLGVPTEDGCQLSFDKGSANLDLRGSKSLPFSVIVSKKCIPVNDAEWESQLQKHHQETTPSSIEVLDANHSLDLDVSEMLPADIVDAGHNPPEEILAIVRPASFNSAVASMKLDQKYILKESFEMSLSIKFSASDGNDENASHVYSNRIKPSLHKGLIGVYIFPLRSKLPKLFHKAGVYSFLLSLGLLIETSELDKIGPNYETTLSICSEDELFSVAIPVQVLPGPLHHISVHPLNYGQKLLPGLVVKELKLEMLDEYNNHIQKDEEIKLQMDGFCAYDQGCLMCKVDENGFINLGGVLKVTAGYGKKASLSVFSGDEAVFKQEFQIEARELRIASEIPEDCVPGSHLENIIFEVINSEGEVDESIHDDEKSGQPHTLTIKSELLKIDETVRYSFCHGRCTVRSITLPEDEGKFHFVAVHSRHMELQLCIEVNTKKAVEPDSGYFQSQSPEMHILNEEVENFQYQCAQKQIFSYENSSPYKVPKLEHDESEADRKKLEDELCHYAQLSSQCETDLQILESKQSNIQTEIFNLEESLGLYSSPNCCCTQESIREKISGRGDSAAAIACKLIETPSSVELHHEFSKEILGVVALLGFAESYELSRVLAEYLGEKQMLAVVCNAHASSSDSSKMHGKQGHLSSADALSTLANNLGTSINGGYDMICLNDIRPYTGELSIDPQRMLAMVKPALPNGESPPGFLGYAVNMIHISAKHLQFRTASGHGLRETLFYRLLGELQVYANRDCMSRASSYFNNHPAVSLDGVIMRGNGVTTHAFG